MTDSIPYAAIPTRGYCQRCGYPVNADIGAPSRCPECGYFGDAQFRPPRRHPPFVTYADIVARARTCLGIARDRAAVGDHHRASSFTRYAEALADLLEIDLRARGESWDVPDRETLEGRLRRAEGALRGPVVAEEETCPPG